MTDKKVGGIKVGQLSKDDPLRPHIDDLVEEVTGSIMATSAELLASSSSSDEIRIITATVAAFTYGAFNVMHSMYMALGVEHEEALRLAEQYVNIAAATVAKAQTDNKTEH